MVRIKINNKQFKANKVNKLNRSQGAPKHFMLFNHISTRTIVDFTRQLATMIQARLPLIRCLEILYNQQANAKFKDVIKQTLQQVKTGKSLNESLKKYPKLFSPLYLNMLVVGELSGNMAIVLDRLACHLEKMQDLKRKLLTALTYPTVIIVVALGAVSFLVFGVLPTFKDMFDDFEATMPLPVRILMASSNWIQSHILIVLLCLLILVLCFRFFLKSNKGRKFSHRIILKIPMIGSIIKKSMIARFTSTLGTMLQSGVSLLEALDVTANSVNNIIIQKQLFRMKDYASKGLPMATALSRAKLFPEMLIQMVTVGEETAELPEMLIQTSVYYEKEVDAAIESLTSIVEPMIIVILGVLLGGVMIAIYMQIFELMNTVG